MSELKKTHKKGDGFDMWWEDRSLPQKIYLGIGFGFLGIGLLGLFGLAVLALWNWLVPDIFGLKQLNYWQACGLLALCAILFKGVRFGDESRQTDRKRRRELRGYIQDGRAADEKESTGSSRS